MTDFAQLGLKELRGRSSYWCSEFGTDCEQGSILRQKHEDTCRTCPYRLAKDEFISGPLGVTNFSYYLNEMQHAGQLGRRSLLILDEGHNTEAVLLGETDIEIKQRQLSEYGIGAAPHGLSIEHYRQWAENVAKNAIENYLQQQERLEHSDSEAQIISFQRIASARKLSMRLGRFIRAENLNDWVAWTKNDNTVTIRPLCPHAHAGRLLFDHANMIIIMSATILDFKTFTRSLVYEPTRVSSWHCPAIFR